MPETGWTKHESNLHSAFCLSEPVWRRRDLNDDQAHVALHSWKSWLRNTWKWSPLILKCQRQDEVRSPWTANISPPGAITIGYTTVSWFQHSMITASTFCIDNPYSDLCYLEVLESRERKSVSEDFFTKKYTGWKRQWERSTMWLMLKAPTS